MLSKLKKKKKKKKNTYNENVMNNDYFIRDFVTINISVINYLPRCSYHLL